MDEFENCPFCNGENIEPRTNNDGLSWYMFYNDCGVSCGYSMSKEELIKARNTRKYKKINLIGYKDCANAMLKMWMDNVVADGEYNRIMDKLNNKYKVEESK